MTFHLADGGRTEAGSSVLEIYRVTAYTCRVALTFEQAHSSRRILLVRAPHRKIAAFLCLHVTLVDSPS